MICTPPQGSGIGLTLFVIYINGMPERLSADSLRYADDVKPIVRRNRHKAHYNSLNLRTSWPKDLEPVGSVSPEPILCGTLPKTLFSPYTECLSRYIVNMLFKHPTLFPAM